MKRQIFLAWLLVTLLWFSSAHAISYNTSSVTIESIAIETSLGISELVWNSQTTHSWIDSDVPSAFEEYDSTDSWGDTSVSYSEDHRFGAAHTTSNLNYHLYANSYMESGYYFDPFLKSNADLFGEFTVIGNGNITFQINYTMQSDIVIEDDYIGLHNLAMVAIWTGELDHYNPNDWPDLIDPVYIEDRMPSGGLMLGDDPNELHETYTGSLMLTRAFTDNQTGYFYINANSLVGSNGSNISAPVPEPATMLLFGTGLAGLVGYRKRKEMKK